MIPLGELLQDKTFKRYFTQTPSMYSTQLNRDAWRIWVKSRSSSGWRKKEINDYSRGVAWLLNHAGEYYDGALQSRGVAYDPPVRRLKVVRDGRPVLQVGKDGIARPRIDEVQWSTPADLIIEYGRHQWCFYCRRPVIFAFFANHHAFRNTTLEGYADASVRRCTLCGITDSFNRGK